MTKTSVTLLALAAALALSACGKQDAPHAAAEGEADAHAASSSAGLPAGNAENGRKLANEGINGGASCVSCHGADGNAPIIETYPKIGGQHQDYLAKALRDYRSGARKNPVMGAMAQPLSAQDIDNVTAYYAKQPGALASRY